METWIKSTLDSIQPLLSMYGDSERVCYNLNSQDLAHFCDRNRCVWIVGVAGSGKNELASKICDTYKSIDAISFAHDGDWVCDCSLINRLDRVVVGSSDNNLDIVSRLIELHGVDNIDILFVWVEPALYRDTNKVRSLDPRFATDTRKRSKYETRAKLSNDDITHMQLHSLFSFLDIVPRSRLIDVVFNSKYHDVKKSNAEI